MNFIAQRRHDERERRRAEIVDAADALARELGWDIVTVDGVARRARLSRALVYLYFSDKTDLHAAVCERAKADLLRRFGATVGTTPPDACPVEAIGRAYVRFAAEMPHYFEALSRFEARPASAGDGGDDSASAHSALHQIIVDVLRKGQQAGRVRLDCGDLDLTAVSLWAFTHGLIQISSTKRSLLEAQGLEHEALLDQAFLMLRRSFSPQD